MMGLMIGKHLEKPGFSTWPKNRLTHWKNECLKLKLTPPAPKVRIKFKGKASQTASTPSKGEDSSAFID